MENPKHRMRSYLAKIAARTLILRLFSKKVFRGFHGGSSTHVVTNCFEETTAELNLVECRKGRNSEKLENGIKKRNLKMTKS